MKNITLTLSLLSIIGLPASALDDPAPGERVEITFPSGGTIMGTIVAPPGTAPAGSLTLDVSWEYPGLTGTITVPKRDVAGLRKIRAMEESGRPAEAPAPAAAPKPAARPPEPPKPAPLPEVKAAEDPGKAREFYARFPAPDWSPERRNMIRVKKFRGQIPTPAEREFDQNFELWEKGREASK
ncbi:MAG TPA: hypothetical protein VN898_00080 [Candidatus Binatia bacterium]|nr:hypothetical protein [Candidatus Binatia bacterium]